MKLVINQVSEAVVLSLVGVTPGRVLVTSEVFDGLERLEDRPWRLTEMAYGWCAAILQDRQTCQSWEWFLLHSLKFGFRHTPSSSRNFRGVNLTHTEHHRELVRIVFNSNDDEAIADLLHAFTIPRKPTAFEAPLDLCTGHILNLHERVMVPFSPRLRRYVLRSIESLGHRGFMEVDVERFVTLLNNLHANIEDVQIPEMWAPVLLEVMETSEAAQYLTIPSWELLVELKFTRWAEDVECSPRITDYLLASQQWDKLECWMGFAWMSLPAPDDTRRGIERATVSLFHQRPGAVQKLTEWMERYWVKTYRTDVPESFQQICNEALSVPFRTYLTQPSPEIRFVLGLPCHPMKEMKNLSVCYRPPSPHRLGATSSGSYYH